MHVLDIDNGARFETYVIRGGPGDVIVNGAAARLVHTGDKVIVISYAQYDEAELEAYEPSSSTSTTRTGRVPVRPARSRTLPRVTTDTGHVIASPS